MKILAFGEILWDIFDSGKTIGGAALNFSAHIAKLGAEVYIVSALGMDVNGDEAYDYCKKSGLNCNFISWTDKDTGYCRVKLDNGLPSYELITGVAYDYIPFDEKMCGKYDALYFGTLSQRSDVSLQTLNQLLEKGEYREIFLDINIRQNFYSKEMIEKSFKKATILKISKEEIGVLNELALTESNDIFDIVVETANKYNIKIAVLTRGPEGSSVYVKNDDRFYHSPKPQSKVCSTVGAGDSYSACFLYNYLNGVPVEQCLERATKLSDYVVTQLGAVPEYPDILLKTIK